jgi:hypothetical protein
VIEFTKPKLEIKAYYEWEEVENWLDSSFNDAMYVVADIKAMLFTDEKLGPQTGFRLISLDKEYTHEDKRVINVYRHMMKHLPINDESFWIYVEPEKSK